MYTCRDGKKESKVSKNRNKLKMGEGTSAVVQICIADAFCCFLMAEYYYYFKYEQPNLTLLIGATEAILKQRSI